jgi:hypothetical protein
MPPRRGCAVAGTGCVREVPDHRRGPAVAYDAMPIGGARPGSFGATRPLDYMTMRYEDILALPVGEMAADDAVLWLWTTNPLAAARSFALVEAWGFEYRTDARLWGKNGHAGRHRLLLPLRHRVHVLVGRSRQAPMSS